MSDASGFDPNRLDKVIHSPVRLAVVAALHAGGRESFTNLKRICNTTDGNLTIHMQVLEQHGIVKVTKQFIKRRPRTTYELTRKGRQVFGSYVACMSKIIGQHGEAPASRG